MAKLLKIITSIFYSSFLFSFIFYYYSDISLLNKRLHNSSSDTVDNPRLAMRKQVSRLGHFKKEDCSKTGAEGFLWLAFSSNKWGSMGAFFFNENSSYETLTIIVGITPLYVHTSTMTGKWLIFCTNGIPNVFTLYGKHKITNSMSLAEPTHAETYTHTCTAIHSCMCKHTHTHKTPNIDPMCLKSCLTVNNYLSWLHWLKDIL